MKSSLSTCAKTAGSNALGRCLFGLEAELAVSATAEGRAIAVGDIVGALAKSAERTLVHLKGASNGLYLANGSHMLVDIGEHLEIATAECTTPWEAVCQLRAGQRTVARLADLIRQGLKLERVLVCRANIDYIQGTSWGYHESYLGVRPILAYKSWLLPHICSRIVYTGAGGLDPLSPGIRLSLSPRVAHLCKVSGNSSTSERAIFNTRDESLCDGYSRIHLLAGNHGCSERATWLGIGATALVVAWADCATLTECPISLVDPLDAIKRFARDPFHETPVVLQDGTRVLMTAVDIQRRLIEMIEPYANDSRYPHWAPSVCAVWKDALNLFETPAAIHASHAFDWPLKFELFRREMSRHGFTEASIKTWSDVLEDLLPSWRPRRDQSLFVDQARIDCLHDKGILSGTDIDKAQRTLRRQGLSWQRLDEFKALRMALCALDVQFGELGAGIFESLDRQGLVPEHRMVSESQIAAAADEAPAGSRAAVRARWIRKLARRRTRYTCSWHGIYGKNRKLDLSDPFLSGEVKWERAQTSEFRRGPLERRGAAMRAYQTGNYLAAEILLDSLIPDCFEIPGTHCHLARILLIQDRVAEAVTEAAAAWESRADAPAYVIPRILVLQLAMCYSAPTETAGMDPGIILGRLKSAVARPEAHMEWIMDPVLEHLQRSGFRIRQRRFLTALVAAANDGTNLPALEKFAAWRNAQAVPLD